MVKEQELKEKLEELEARTKIAEKNYDKLAKLKSKIKIEYYKLKHKGLIGKYFKRRNQYGSGTEWWLYYKILDIVDDRNVKTESFQLCSKYCGRREFQFVIDESTYFDVVSVGVEISKEEYEKAKMDSLKEIGIL